MRLFVLSLMLASASAVLRAGDQPRPASADEIVLLKDAMRNNHQDTEHWAYTETTLIEASKGRPRGETVVRFDPSQPFAKQFTPVKVEGKPPSERQLKQYRERGEKRGEKVMRAAEAARSRPPGEPPSFRIGGGKVTLDLDHPLVVYEESGGLTYEVPLHGNQKGVPMDNFQLLIRANPKTRLVETVTLHLRESFRLKLVAKIKAGEARLNFAVVDPKYGPVIASMTGNLGASVMLIPVNATFTNTRTEWQRVKAYDERLSVKLGPMQFMDF